MMHKKANSLFAVLLVLCILSSAVSVGFCAPASVDLNIDQTSCVAKHGVVASSHPLASQAGIDILKQGGNAFDAAIATGLALGVVEPTASGIGGNGFATIYVAKEKKFYTIDFSAIAPQATSLDLYPAGKEGMQIKRDGYYAAAVPGEVAGFELISKKFGNLKWNSLFKPAIDYAENGFTMNETVASAIKGNSYRQNNLPSQDTLEQLYFKDGQPKKAGDTVLNPQLAISLQKIANGGADVFYKGEIADAIVKYYAEQGHGFITKNDLENYHPIMREPVAGNYRGRYTIVSQYPPSSGGLTLLNIFNILEGYDLRNMPFGSANYIHTVLESYKIAFENRARYLGDPAFVNIEKEHFLDKQMAAEQRIRINMGQTFTPVKLKEPVAEEHDTTTSYSVIDAEGNMISITKTVGSYFGSGVIPDGTGIVLNNVMNLFTLSADSPNAPQVGKRPLSAMSPTIVLKDGKPFMTLGSPGSRKIITAVANVILNVVEGDMSLKDAIDSPRFHNENTVKDYFEDGFSQDILNDLQNRGRKIELKGRFEPFFGGLSAVMIGDDGKIYGGADPRRHGAALGY